MKTTSSNSRNIQIFSKGVSPWFWSKIGHFSIFSFQAIQARKMCFRIFQKEKTPFQAMKTRSLNSRKIEIFSKGVSPWFWSKIVHFSIFLFQAIQARKMCFRIFQKEKTPFQAMKTRSLNSRKIEIFSKGVSPWFWSKIVHFSIFLFQAIQARKMCFTIFQKEKTPFQDIKGRSLKSRKIVIFSKGLVYGFAPKFENFLFF